jgi:hypothetical protein
MVTGVLKTMAQDSFCWRLLLRPFVLSIIVGVVSLHSIPIFNDKRLHFRANIFPLFPGPSSHLLRCKCNTSPKSNLVDFCSLYSDKFVGYAKFELPKASESAVVFAKNKFVTQRIFSV